MKLAKVLADYVLSRETKIKVDVPLSVYADTFVEVGKTENIDGAAAFIQHAIDTDWLINNKNSEDEFPDIPKQVKEIIEQISITPKAKSISDKLRGDK